MEIDYLSIDTEGSEFLILKNFDFQKHTIKLITVEHNYAESGPRGNFRFADLQGLCAHVRVVFGLGRLVRA